LFFLLIPELQLAVNNRSVIPQKVLSKPDQSQVDNFYQDSHSPHRRW